MGRDISSDDHFFGSMVLEAEVLSTLWILDDVCHQLGYQDPDGLSMRERFYKQRRIDLELLFRSLENRDPALAARIHERYERAKKELGEDRS